MCPSEPLERSVSASAASTNQAWPSFKHPEQLNLFPVDDLEGSAADAQVLAFHIWPASRFDEHRNSPSIDLHCIE